MVGHTLGTEALRAEHSDGTHAPPMLCRYGSCAHPSGSSDVLLVSDVRAPRPLWAHRQAPPRTHNPTRHSFP